MIARKSKVRRINSQLTASMRLLKSVEATLVKQLTRAIHPVMSMRDVTGLVALVEAREKAIRSLCEQAGPLEAKDNDEIVLYLLGSPEGEETARQSLRQHKEIAATVARWDDGRSLARQQIEKYEPTRLTLRDRALAQQYTALCRQAEAHDNLLDALLYGHYLQFWVWGDKFHFAGQPQNA